MSGIVVANICAYSSSLPNHRVTVDTHRTTDTSTHTERATSRCIIQAEVHLSTPFQVGIPSPSKLSFSYISLGVLLIQHWLATLHDHNAKSVCQRSCVRRVCSLIFRSERLALFRTHRNSLFSRGLCGYVNFYEAFCLMGEKLATSSITTTAATITEGRRNIRCVYIYIQWYW